MVQIFKAVALGLLILAITLHLIGFVTHNWVSADLDMRGTASLMSANKLASQPPSGDLVGLSIKIGLWKMCFHLDMGKMMNSMTGLGQDADDENWQNLGEDLDQENNFGTDHQRRRRSASAMDGTVMDVCRSVQSEMPGWMKGVQALGIMALIVAVLSLALTSYSFLGDSKGDRARLLPYIIGGVSLVAGLLLLIAVTLYAAEFDEMTDQLNMMDKYDPSLKDLAENFKDNTKLGYSFALESVAGVLIVIASLMMVIPAMKGWDASFSFGGPRNMAV